MKKRKLTEMYGLKEGPFDDVQNALNGSQSLRGGPTTSSNVRKHQDRAKRYSPDVAKAQSDLDSAKSVFDEADDGGTTPVDLTKQELQMIAGWAAFAGATESPQAKKLLDKIESAIGGGSSMGMSVSKKTPFGGM